ncbi:MAG: sensor histidine kinase, partial [Anaerovoracaceae bacterium]
AGLISIVAALLILGAAITAGVLRIDEVRCFWKVGCMAFFLGGFLLLDTINTSFRSELLVFNTYGRQLCLMLMVYCMEFYVVGTFKGAVGKTAEKFMLLSAVFDCVLIVVSMAGKMIIYDTGMYWKASQMVICPVLILCCIIDMRKKGKGKKLIEAFYIVMLLSVPADVFGVCDCIYSHENCTKAMLLMFLTGYIALSIKRIVKDYEAALRASRLEKELEENRIAVMLSQIQPHFLYNVLVCIRKLCETDAKQAQAALDDFSAYLRGNMDSLKSRELIPFSQELKHIETYLNLEKLRFGDELQVEYDLQTEDFEIPSLSIQPIVENAAKHGVGQKSGGGTVTLRTRKEGEKITIVVEDNGVGFDINNPVNDGRSHIGIQNVRERLRKMADAELDIQSTPGKGTKVTVVMEKSQKER